MAPSETANRSVMSCLQPRTVIEPGSSPQAEATVPLGGHPSRAPTLKRLLAACFRRRRRLRGPRPLRFHPPSSSRQKFFGTAVALNGVKFKCHPNPRMIALIYLTRPRSSDQLQRLKPEVKTITEAAGAPVSYQVPSILGHSTPLRTRLDIARQIKPAATWSAYQPF